MTFKPHDWSVVIVGRWNASILTPKNIVEHIYKLDTNTPCPIFVPLDGLSPYLVRHPDEDITTMLDNDRFRIQLEKLDFNTLEKALKSAIRLLEWLPVTPVSAGGFNIRYKTDEVLEEVMNLTEKSKFDDPISEMDYTIASRSLVRSLEYDEGRLNINITKNTDCSEVLFNFHKGSESIDDLKKWFNTPIYQIQNNVKLIFEKLTLSFEES